jgi:hypothetical protein
MTSIGSSKASKLASDYPKHDSRISNLEAMAKEVYTARSKPANRLPAQILEIRVKMSSIRLDNSYFETDHNEEVTSTSASPRVTDSFTTQICTLSSIHMPRPSYQPIEIMDDFFNAIMVALQTVQAQTVPGVQMDDSWTVVVVL